MEAANDLRQIDIVKIYNKKKCLIVDDFAEIRGSLARTLRNFGLGRVDTAADGDQAVRLCTQNDYDIVICDYNLGHGKDGQQVLEEVRHRRALLMTRLFVMLTGESSREMVLGALEYQPDDYITKPYTTDSLKARLNRAVLRHENLMPIKQAISNGDYQEAVRVCDLKIRQGSRYAADCIKMKGQLLLLLGQYEQAKALYDTVLAKKPLIWAKIGLGKTLLAMGQLDASEELLTAIIRDDGRYIEAHDMLADVYLAKNDRIGAQVTIEKAAQISPKSVARHRRLAELADANGDSKASMQSHHQAIRFAVHSCHESAQDYFNYARKVSDVVREQLAENDAAALVRKAISYLDRARKRYADSVEVQAQSEMAEAQLYHSQGKKQKAQKALATAKALYQNLEDPPIQVSLDFARALYAMNDEEQAREILTALVASNPKDNELLGIIDSITSEPVSEGSKLKASRLTKEGIKCYDQKDFTSAVTVFNKALTRYPRHVGLNLNLIQAILAASSSPHLTGEHQAMCQRSLRLVEHIPPHHKQFQRLTFIAQKLNKYYPDTLAFSLRLRELAWMSTKDGS